MGTTTIDTSELRAFAQALKKTEQGFEGGEIGRIAAKVGDVVLRRARFHDRTGRLRSAWSSNVYGKRAAMLHGSAAIAPYVQVQEFGGWVRWQSRSGRWTRVPINGNIRMLYANAIFVKPPVGYTFRESYYIYPAFKNNQEEIEQTVRVAIVEMVEDYIGE